MQCPELRGLYTVDKLVGQGASGAVYRAHRCKDNRLCAVKRFHLTVPPKHVHSEILFMRLLGDQPHILSLLDAFRRGPQMSLVLAYCPAKDFESFYEDMTLAEVRIYLEQLLKALCCLHAHGVLHRDVKPPNFLYDPVARTGSLVDFGLAELNTEFQPVLPPAKAATFFALLKMQRGQKSQARGTKGFLAPECLFGEQHLTSAVDMWAAGVIFLSLLSKRYPFFHFHGASPLRSVDYRLQGLIQIAALWGRTEVEQLASHFHCDLELPYSLPAVRVNWALVCPEASTTALDLLERLLALKPEERISALDALGHPFFHTD